MSREAVVAGHDRHGHRWTDLRGNDQPGGVPGTVRAAQRRGMPTPRIEAPSASPSPSEGHGETQRPRPDPPPQQPSCGCWVPPAGSRGRRSHRRLDEPLGHWDTGVSGVAVHAPGRPARRTRCGRGHRCARRARTDLDRIESHINSVPRQIYCAKSAAYQFDIYRILP